MKGISPVIVANRRFTATDFVGGDPALDFINTVTGRDKSPHDWLDSYERLVEWSELVGLLPRKYSRGLREKMRDEKSASRALARAKELREALFAIFSAMSRDTTPSRTDLALLRTHWIAGTAAHELRLDADRMVVAIRSDALDLDLITALIAYRVVHHVFAEPTSRLRMCEGENCAWLFIDRSKAGRRRWCDMAVCGNAAKSKRFYARSRKTTARASRTRASRK